MDRNRSYVVVGKYKAKATLIWELETDQSANAVANNQLKKLLEPLDNVVIQVNAVRQIKQEKTTVLGEFLPDDVLPYVTNGNERREYFVNGKKYLVKMDSDRYFVFKTSLYCSSCGVVGTKMLLEQHPKDKSPHFNLYAEEDGQLVLMTKDHIQAKSNGGTNTLSNLQNLCVVCNNLKGSDNLTLANIAELRKIYNANKHIPKKKLSALIQAHREILLTATATPPLPFIRPSFVAKMDLLVAKTTNEEIKIMPLCEFIVERNHIACIKRGSRLSALTVGENHYLQFGQNTCLLPTGLIEIPSNG
jgi:5-methylcytosine-specific restriction endonuclease McrA